MGTATVASVRDNLADAIAAFIRQGADGESAHNVLALRVFAYQYQYNTPYRRFCDGRGVTPDTVSSWRHIPAAPAAAFKHFELTCAPEMDCKPERGGRIFHSSGTTGTETSRHFLDAAALDLYRVSLKAGYDRFVPISNSVIVALMPPPEEAPHSSLSFMLRELNAQFFWNEGWPGQVAAWLQVQEKPYTIFGTAFAWVHFFDTADGEYQLPEDSIVIETGGFKGRSREVPREELYRLFTQCLGVPPSHCLAEYGMSEMASQFYDSTLRDYFQKLERMPRKVAPPWLKTRVLDPLTGEETPSGTPGLLAHYDLANLNSVLALQTEDYGYAEPDGGFVLLGRAPGAILRGCSLTAEQLF